MIEIDKLSNLELRNMLLRMDRSSRDYLNLFLGGKITRTELLNEVEKRQTK